MQVKVNNMARNILIPNKYRKLGLLLLLAGIIVSILYFYNDFRFKIPVFALVSSFLKTKYLTVFSTNFSDELAMILLFAGLSMIAFSKEKNENLLDEDSLIALSGIRGLAMFKAIIINTLFLFFSVLFLYGKVFIFILIFNMFFSLIIYIILYYVDLRKSGLFKKDI